MQVAHNARIQSRLEASYEALLLQVGQANDWAFRLYTNPFTGDWSLSNPPSIAISTLSARGVLSAYRSAAISDLVLQLKDALHDCRTIWIGMQGAADGIETANGPERLRVAKERVETLEKRIEQQVRSEMFANQPAQPRRGFVIRKASRGHPGKP